MGCEGLLGDSTWHYGPIPLNFALPLIVSYHKIRLQPAWNNACICVMVEEAVVHFEELQHHHTLFKMRSSAVGPKLQIQLIALYPHFKDHN